MNISLTYRSGWKAQKLAGEYYAFFIIANMQVNKKEDTVNKHMPFNTTV